MSKDTNNSGASNGGVTLLKSEGLALAAVSGSLLTTAQALLNKIATVIAMWIVAKQLDPSEFGMASLVLSIGVYLVFLPPLTVGDVLVANQRHCRTVSRVGLQIATVAGASCAAFTLVSAPLVSERFSQYPASDLGLFLAVIAVRPLAEAAIATPLATLRRLLRYRVIAVTDGSIQFAATLAMVLMAVWGGGVSSLILPQIVAVCIRAVAYWIAAKSQIHVEKPSPRVFPAVRRMLWAQFMLAAIAQYTHNVVVMLPVLILGYRSSEVETGLYAMASTLSAQANALVASQLGTVLQPIFGRLNMTKDRQFAGFTRVLRTLGAVAVPLTLIQAASAQPLFMLAFDPKWLDAIAVFAILSSMEGLYFATAPTMALLRAQRRFSTYFLWQMTHFFFAGVLYWVVAPEYGALGVAIVSLCCWGFSAPLAVWLAAPVSERSMWTVGRIFLDPVVIALPNAACLYLSASYCQSFGRTGQIVSLALIAPLALLLCFVLMRAFQPMAWTEVQGLLSGLAKRLKPR